MIAAQRISQLTPMEVDILFTMSDLYEANGRITMRDIERITPFEEGVLPYNIASQQSEQMTAPGERNVAYFDFKGRFPGGGPSKSTSEP